MSGLHLDSRSKIKDVVSVVVRIGESCSLFKLNQALPLEDIIEQLCRQNDIEYVPNQYALQITDAKEGNINKYVTENNRTSYITDACELRLIFSAQEMCRLIREKIVSNYKTCEESEDIRWSIEKLCSLSKDQTFCEEFVLNYGISDVVSLIQREKLQSDILHLCIVILSSFFKFNLIADLSEIPVKQIISFVTPYVESNSCSEFVIEASLAFLKTLLVSKQIPDSIKEDIKSTVSLDNIIEHFLNRNNMNLPEKALAYINVVCSDTNSNLILSKLASKQVRDIIYKNIIVNAPVSQNMARELYVYQTLILSLLNSKLSAVIETGSDEALSLQDLNNISYTYEQHIKRDSMVSLLEENPPDPSSSRTSSVYEYDINSPTTEKFKTPQLHRCESSIESETEEESRLYDRSNSLSLEICHLTLDCMLYFAWKNRKTYTKIMLMEEKVQRKPFSAICDRLVHLLCDVLQVGQKPSCESTCYQPLVFEASEESPFFEELFCHVAIRLTSTSKEMKARTSQDHEKVMKVLQHQVIAVLKKQLNSWKKFEEALQMVTYEKVVETWQSENDQNLMRLQDLPAVIELRESLKQQMEELISKQRLIFLCQGTRFIKPSLRGQKFKKKYWFIYLSPNHTVFHYGDCNENEIEYSKCASKMSVSWIKELVVGKKCPHVREAKNNRKPEPEFAFSLLIDQLETTETTSLDFIAPTQEIYDYWIDGLSFLLGKKMKSKSMEMDLKNLLDMEVRLQLLDIEDINIPHSAPPIPKSPYNYNFNEP